MKKTQIIFGVVVLLFGFLLTPLNNGSSVLGGGTGTISTLDQFTSTSSPASAITQRIFGKTVRFTGYNAGCAEFSSNGTISSTGVLCGTGSGGGSDPFTHTNNFGVVTSATNTPIWGQAGIFASSTSRFEGLFVNGIFGASSTVLFTNGFTAFSSSTLQNFTGFNSTTTNATTTSFAVSALTANMLVASNGIKGLVSTSTIGNNQLQNSSITINTTPAALGSSVTITAASSTLLANNNTFTGINVFSAAFAASSTALFGQGFTAYASSTIQDFTFKTATGTAATTTNLFASIGSFTNILRSGTADGCATWASGLLGTTGVACGSGGGGSNTDKWATSTDGATIEPNSGGGIMIRASSTLQNFTAQNATTSQATTTSFAVSGTATSTFAGGVNLSSGCFSILNSCVGGAGGGSGTINSGTAGQAAYYKSAGTTIDATSTLVFSQFTAAGSVPANSQLSTFTGGVRINGATSNGPQVGYAALGNYNAILKGAGSTRGAGVAFDVSSGAAFPTGQVSASIYANQGCGSSNGANLNFYTWDDNFGAGGLRQTIACNGRTGFGSTTPLGIVSIQATTTYLSSKIPLLVMATTTNGTQSTTTLLVDSRGFMGLSTTSPFANFSVQGNSAQLDPLFVVASSTSAKATTTFMIDRNGNVGIGTNPIPSGILDTTGKVFMRNLSSATNKNALCIDAATNELVDAGNVTCALSSQFVKMDISSITSEEAQEFLKVRPVVYTEKDGGERRYGFIAEELDAINPLFAEHAREDITVQGHAFKKGDPISANYLTGWAVLTKLVQDQQTQIDLLKLTARPNEKNWQWVLIGLLSVGFVYQQVQIYKLKNSK